MRHMTIIGNICADPRIGETPSGAKVANLRVAANEREKNAETGEYENKAEFFDVDIWRGVDAIAQFFGKGSGIGLAGDFGTREWTDRDGNVRTNLCLHNASWWFLPKSDGAQGNGDGAATQTTAPKSEAVSDDDIPF
jgi:single-strand DNA-binding protein